MTDIPKGFHSGRYWNYSWMNSGKSTGMASWGTAAGCVRIGKDIAQQNIAWQRENAQANRDFSREIIDMSKPDLSSDELTNLLLNQGEQQANVQRDRGLSQVTRDMTRAGTPSSGNDVIARTIAEMSAAQGDRGIDSRLKGTLGVLPGAAALQIGGSLYNQGPTQNNYQPQADMTTPLAIGGIGNLLGQGLDWYLGNTGVGDKAVTGNTGVTN